MKTFLTVLIIFLATIINAQERQFNGSFSSDFRLMFNYEDVTTKFVRYTLAAGVDIDHNYFENQVYFVWHYNDKINLGVSPFGVSIRTDHDFTTPRSRSLLALNLRTKLGRIWFDTNYRVGDKAPTISLILNYLKF